MAEDRKSLLDIARAQRQKLSKLLFERIVLGYAFSYSKLYKLLESCGMDDEEIRVQLSKCILATGDEEEKTVKADLNDQISSIYVQNDIKSLREADPFGRVKDCGVYESKSVILNKSKLIENAPTFGISTSKIMELIAASTITTPFVAMSVREVKSE